MVVGSSPILSVRMISTIGSALKNVTCYFCPDDGIGIRVGLRNQILRVRVSLGAPIMEVWQSLVYCTCLENRRSEKVREFESHRFRQICSVNSVVEDDPYKIGVGSSNLSPSTIPDW